MLLNKIVLNATLYWFLEHGACCQYREMQQTRHFTHGWHTCSGLVLSALTKETGIFFFFSSIEWSSVYVFNWVCTVLSLQSCSPGHNSSWPAGSTVPWSLLVPRHVCCQRQCEG